MCFVSDILCPMNEEGTTPRVLTLNAQVPGFMYTLNRKIKKYICYMHEAFPPPQCHQTYIIIFYITLFSNKFLSPSSATVDLLVISVLKNEAPSRITSNSFYLSRLRAC
jgi:hypothetical protein